MKNILVTLFVLPLFCFSQVDSNYINLFNYKENSTQQIDLMIDNFNNFYKKTRKGQFLQMLGIAGTYIFLNESREIQINSPEDFKDLEINERLALVSGSFIFLGGIMQYSAQKLFSKRFMKVKNIANRVKAINPNIPSKLINEKNEKLVDDSNLMNKLSNLEKGQEYYIQTHSDEYNAKLIGNARQMLQIKYKENGKKTIKIINYADVISIIDL